MNDYSCLIIGAGPCGIGTAIKLKEKGIKSAIIEKSMPGGKVNICPRVDNYPGKFQIPGPELAAFLYSKAKDHDVEIISDEVVSLEKENDKFVLKCNNNTYHADSVMVASGTIERKVGLEKEDKLLGHGISYCALCDGHFFKGKDIAVIGGGNAALKEAIYLANLANHLYLIHRRNQFRGNDKLVEELANKPNVDILTPFIPLSIIGEDKVEGLIIQNKDDNSVKELKIDGLFPLVGQIPQTSFIKIENVLNEYGNIPFDKTMMSNVDGLFAGGDVSPREIKQIYLSEHDGMVAANSIESYLNSKKQI